MTFIYAPYRCRGAAFKATGYCNICHPKLYLHCRLHNGCKPGATLGVHCHHRSFLRDPCHKGSKTSDVPPGSNGISYRYQIYILRRNVVAVHHFLYYKCPQLLSTYISIYSIFNTYVASSATKQIYLIHIPPAKIVIYSSMKIYNYFPLSAII